MAKGIAILSSTIGAAHTRLAEEALKDAAHRQHFELEIRLNVAEAAQEAHSALESNEYDRVILGGETLIEEQPTLDKTRFFSATASQLIRTPEQFIEQSQPAAIAKEKAAAYPVAPAATVAPCPVLSAFSAERAGDHDLHARGGSIVAPAAIRLVAVTSCPTGIAHTFMAAAALQKAGADLGYQIKVETQGSVGAKNTLTDEEIRTCSAAIIAADTNVDPSRFANVRLLSTSTNDAIHHGKDVIARALALPAPAEGKANSATAKPEKKQRTGPYKHLMTGVSHMLPLVTAGGLLIALAFAIGGIHAGDQSGTLGWALMQIGGATAFKLYIAVLSAYIAYSIADRPGLCPGLVGGMLSMTLGAGFLGGIVSGFLAGYVTKLINDKLPLPDALAGLKPVLILPVCSTLIVGLAMIFVIGAPVKLALSALTLWLSGMQQSSALVLGLLLGGMMAFDMGGPVNKAAYTFSVGLLASNVFGPMAAVMAAGMTPPLAIALATLLFRNRFSAFERNEGKVTAILGLSFVTEGAIPFAAADPIRVIPCLVAGSALTGAISMASGCKLMVPHGGAFVLLIPHAVAGLPAYALAIVSGALLSGLLLGIVKKKNIEAV